MKVISLGLLLFGMNIQFSFAQISENSNYSKSKQEINHHLKKTTLDSVLSLKEQNIIIISSLTAKGDLNKLKIALGIGLDSGLTVNEIKEILVHLYAYCGFPRSIRGLQTFMTVLDERKTMGYDDLLGNEASIIEKKDSKYERGKKILEELTQTSQPMHLTGYSAFAPIIDSFLKEHLFSDIFERDILTYTERELITISVISTIGRAEPMLQSHLKICLNVGLSPNQLQQFISIIKSTAGKKKSKSAKKILNEILKSDK
ncbi:carboxymuconolactone decarboxylase family protein [Apibacter sp. HY039]|uniref:carboxymuconolactone decarboxylase family protein n=1 Tax=Apibacter sp. HY039 TaxID=2501476 RepID=UPI0021052D74|nr:carboxymuconolactone decarboxylase family protein [Apibacter sp. HY039]